MDTKVKFANLTPFVQMLKRFENSASVTNRGGRWRVSKGGYDCNFVIYYDERPFIECVLNTCQVINDLDFDETLIKKIKKRILTVYPNVSFK